MKKLILSLVVCALASTVNAQYTNFNSDSKFTDNWSIGFEGGIQANLSNWKNSHGGVFGLNLNKDLSPYFGLSIEGILGADVALNWMENGQNLKNGKGVDYLTGFVTGRWNVTNSLGGFKGYRRVFELETNVGLGYGRFYTHNVNYNNWNAFQIKTGLNFNFYVDEEKSLAINLRPAVVWSLANTGQMDSRYGVVQLTAGLTYHFKTSNGTHYYVKSGAAQLQDELAALTALNADLQAQWANRPIVEKEVIVEKVIDTTDVPKAVTDYVEKTFAVNFAFNSAQLVGNAKAILDKIPANSTVDITGYASPEGGKEYNIRLSERRADAVKAYLESRGVKVNKTVGLGANNAEANRIVMVNII